MIMDVIICLLALWLALYPPHCRQGVGLIKKWYNHNMCVSNIEKHGADPANVQWKVVRGDSAILKIEFFDDDEITYFDTSDWEFLATAYDSRGDVLDELIVVPGEGYAEIKISSEVSENWGIGFKSVVAEIPFDLQVLIPGEDTTTWTPLIGSICVIGDVSPGGSL
jgi:hypothetical protein